MGCLKRIALIPVKNFRTAKSRLAGVLSLGERQTLANWMFWRVLGQIRRSGLFSEAVVLSKGSLLQDSKEGFPVHVVEQDPKLGLEEALNAYFLESPWAGFEHFLLPADLPLLSQRDFWGLMLCIKKEGAEGLLVPSMDGRGTNGVYLKNPSGQKLAFGTDNSLSVNRARLERSGVHPGTYYSLGFALDVDTEEDLLWALHNGLPFRGLV